MKSYDTNLAAEFFVLSALHRLGLSATLTLGNKKSVDIVVVRAAGESITIDVKGLAGSTNWPVDNVKEPRANHFIIFVCFRGKIADPTVSPEVYVVPSKAVPGLIYQNPAGNRRVIPLGRARKNWSEFKDTRGWNQLVDWSAGS